MSNWDHEVDLIAVGSGAGGMSTAIVAHDQGLKTLVLEKSQYYGGTTAVSGGVIWVANNHQMSAKGIADSAMEGFNYLKQVTKGEVAEARLKAYVTHAAEMVKYFEDHTRVKFEAAEKYCDYYPELDGGKLGARSLDPKPFSRRLLGKEINNQQPPRWKGVLNRFSLTAKESHFVLDITYKSVLFIAYRLMLHYLDLPSRLRGLPNNRATLGAALVGHLRRSLMDRDVPVWLNAGVENLIQENGCVVGVETRKEGKILRIKARHGVVMAAGGFAQNSEMRKQYQRAPISNEWTSAVDTDMGDGIRMGQTVGAELEFMHCAWWTPTIKQPDGSNWALIIGKAMPGSIMVDQSGCRFTNEAAPYEDVVKGQYAANSDRWSAIPAYLIFDAKYREKYPIGILPPSRIQPDSMMSNEYKNSDFILRADTLSELAQKLGLNEEGLIKTVTQHNKEALEGKDSLFGRGNSASDRYYSDPKNKPNPCLAPLEQTPFYAVKIYPGDLGTKGGLKCDEFARVLDTGGNVIPGLYATGNCSGAVMGDSYPGAGSTIGPAMTFGYIAARHAAAKSAQKS